MEGGMLVMTYFLAGRATRISRNGAFAMARGAARAAAWTTLRVVSSARLLNPFTWRRAVSSARFLNPFRMRRDGVADRRRLRREILEISAAEQRRIGQDLHDGVGQILSGVAFMSRALERKLAAALPDGAADAAQIAQIAEEAMAKTRCMARVLNPMRLEAGGLILALGEMASDFEKIFGVTCTFEHDARPAQVGAGLSVGRANAPGVAIDDDAVAMHLYRIAQEATTNAVRHGKAKHVVIGLSLEGEHGALTVQDDGTGFPDGSERPTEGPAPASAGPEADATPRKEKGLGLRIMDYRAGMIGGELIIRRRPEGGSLLMCAFPRTEER